MAKPKSKTQRSFFDSDHFLSHLLDPKRDRVYLLVKQVIAPLIQDQDYAAMYSPVGRRPISPRTLVLTMILQFLENLPDRQTARNVVLRLDWKLVLGLELDDPGFHFSLLQVFRDRLEAHDKQRAAFDVLLEKLKELGLIRKRQNQRLDSTHVLGHLRRLSRLECLAESLRLVLERLCCLLGEASFGELVPAALRERYLEALDTHKLDRQEIRRSLQAAGRDTLMLLELIEVHSESSRFSMLEEVRTLRRIFEQYFQVTPEGTSALRESPPKGTGKDRVVTPHDPEARWSEKRGKDWVGYKLQVTETAERPTEQADGTREAAVNFITDVEVTNAAAADAEYTQQAIDRQQDQGLSPEELAVDQAYVSGAHLAQASRKGVVLMGPVAACSTNGVALPQEAFSIDLEREEAVCPEGIRSVYWKQDQKGSIQIRFPAGACSQCPIKLQCTKSKHASV